MYNNTQQPTLPMIGWQNIGNTQTGNLYGTPKMNFNFGKDSKDVFNNYMKQVQTQQTWNNWMSAGEKVLNTAGQITAMALNYKIMSKYYGLQQRIADHQYDLGIRALDLETDRLATAERMNHETLEYQKRVARIQSQTAVAISQIKQRGTTERAKVFAAMNAFHRTNYQYGQPTFQTSVLS